MRHRYVWFYGLVSAIVMLLSFSAPAAPVWAGDPGLTEYVPNEVLVKLSPLANVLTISAAYGLDPTPGAIDQLGARPIYRLRIIDGTPPPVKAAALAQHLLVVYAEPNY